MKTTIFTALISLTLMTVKANMEDVWIVPEGEQTIDNEQTQGGLWTQGVFPGLKLRVSQGFVNLVHQNILEYGASYLNYGYQFDKSGQYTLNVFPLKLDFFYDNLQHDRLKFDLTKFHFDFTTSPQDGTPVIFIELPMVDYFGYRFDYRWQAMGGLFHGDGHMHFSERQSFGLATVHLTATDKGHLYPQLHDLKLHFGSSEVNANNSTIQSHFYEASYNVIKTLGISAINSFGKNIYNKMLPEFTRRFFTDQVYKFDHNWGQLNRTGSFNLDWGLIKDPRIHNGVIDLEMFMDVGKQGSKCNLKSDQHEYYFQDFDDRYLQFILSDRVVNCYLNAMEEQGMLHYTFNTKAMMRHFGTGIKVNAALIADAWPQIAQTYGPDQELDIEFRIQRPTVKFGSNHGENIHQHNQVRIGIRLHDSPNYILYDEVMIQSFLSVGIREEILRAEMSILQMYPYDDRERKQPSYASIPISDEEYQDFWAWTSVWCSRWQSFFNDDVFGFGVPLPYQPLSLMTHMTFHPRAMLMVIGTYYGNNI